MRMIWVLPLVVCAVAAQPAPKPTPARVSGRVLNANGDALHRAVVRLVGAGSFTKNTDERGGFVIDNVPPGTYSIYATRRGYFSQKYGGAELLEASCQVTSMSDDYAARCALQAPGISFQLSAGKERTGLVFKLAPITVVTGRVTDRDGEPVVGWRVQASRRIYRNGSRRLSVVASAKVDTEGNYSLDGMPPGDYLLSVTDFTGNMFGPNPDERFGKPEPEQNLTTYYPSAAGPDQAKTISVTLGADVTGVDIQVRRMHVYTISGKVVASGNLDTSTQLVTLTIDGGDVMTNRTSRVGAEGRFEFRGVEPGVYTLRGGQAFANPGMPPPLFGNVPVTVGAADVDGITLPLVPGIEVTGTFVAEGKKPPEWPQLMLLSREDNTGTMAGGVDAKGAFRFPRSLAPSKLTSNITAPAGWYLKAIRYGNQDGLHGLIDLGKGGGSLDVVLSSNVATVSGTVKNADGTPAAGVVVSAWARQPELLQGVRSATSGEDGRFEIHDLGPGERFVAAWQQLDKELIDAPEFVARFQALATPVTLEEGGHAEVEVKLILRARIAEELEKLK